MEIDGEEAWEHYCPPRMDYVYHTLERRECDLCGKLAPKPWSGLVEVKAPPDDEVHDAAAWSRVNSSLSREAVEGYVTKAGLESPKDSLGLPRTIYKQQRLGRQLTATGGEEVVYKILRRIGESQESLAQDIQREAAALNVEDAKEELLNGDGSELPGQASLRRLTQKLGKLDRLDELLADPPRHYTAEDVAKFIQFCEDDPKINLQPWQRWWIAHLYCGGTRRTLYGRGTVRTVCSCTDEVPTTKED